MGKGDLHDTLFDDSRRDVVLTQYKDNTTAAIGGHCVYSFSLYTSSNFNKDSESALPAFFTVAVAIIFVLMSVTFCMYDRFVRRRNAKVVNAAARSNAIISSLFPTNVRERLFAEAQETNNQTNSQAPKSRLKSMLNSGELHDMGEEDADEDEIMYKTKPIADLFPETTIIFADIAGFTAWSSVREPSQVFILLET